MTDRLVLLHGWGANADDLRPLGEALAQRHHAPLEVVALNAPDAHPQPPGRQWYGLFPAQWDQVPQAVGELRQRLLDLDGDQGNLDSTVLFGFSQGGAMALHCGCGLPIAGVISCSGYPHPGWQPPANHPPVLLLHGQQDNIVPVEALEEIWSRLDVERRDQLLFNDGHAIPSELMTPLGKTLQRMLPVQKPFTA